MVHLDRFDHPKIPHTHPGTDTDMNRPYSRKYLDTIEFLDPRRMNIRRCLESSFIVLSICIFLKLSICIVVIFCFVKLYLGYKMQCQVVSWPSIGQSNCIMVIKCNVKLHRGHLVSQIVSWLYSAMSSCIVVNHWSVKLNRGYNTHG